MYELEAFFGQKRVVKSATVDFWRGEVTAIIGPSGCGKSTLLRCMNRMHEESRGASIRGLVTLSGVDIHEPNVSPIKLRRKIGMVFQRPSPFPTMSIEDNVTAGLRSHGRRCPDTVALREAMEDALRRSDLWEEVKDRLRSNASCLSGGQQQRLCIARALATSPEVLLLDEPTAALDPVSTIKIEELIHHLRSQVTVVMVTHNIQQAARVSDQTIFMLDGEVVENGRSNTVFTSPKDTRTEGYITGRFG